MLRRVIVLLLLLQVCAAPAWAAQSVNEPTPRELAKGSSARVVEVVDGDTVVLDDGKRGPSGRNPGPEAAAQPAQLQGMATGAGGEGRAGKARAEPARDAVIWW